MAGDPPGPGPEVAHLDTGVPHIARIYDYCLGGKDNFAADRAAAEEFVRHRLNTDPFTIRSPH
jgi:hypothetical protein